MKKVRIKVDDDDEILYNFYQPDDIFPLIHNFFFHRLFGSSYYLPIWPLSFDGPLALSQISILKIFVLKNIFQKLDYKSGE